MSSRVPFFRQSSATIEEKRRLTTLLELVSFALTNTTAAVLAGVLIGGWELWKTATFAAVVAAASASFTLWHRSRYPAQLAEDAEDAEDVEGAASEAAGFSWRSIVAPFREDPPQGLGDVLWMLVIGVVVTIMLGIKLVFAFLIPLAIPIALSLATAVDGTTLWLALGATLAAGLVIDVVVTHVAAPLLGLNLVDAPERTQADFCPPPDSEE